MVADGPSRRLCACDVGMARERSSCDLQERWWNVTRLVATVLVVTFLGCTSAASNGSAGPQGPTGPTGPTGPAGSGFGGGSGDGGSSNGPLCTPGGLFCDGHTIWNCTRSGLDGYAPTDCSAEGSATNPSTCGTSGCPGDAGACCQSATPVCQWNLTGPVALSGSTLVPGGGGGCTPPHAPTACNGSFTVSLNTGDWPTGCPSSVIALTISDAGLGT
jgi:hypothetical protein